MVGILCVGSLKSLLWRLHWYELMGQCKDLQLFPTHCVYRPAAEYAGSYLGYIFKQGPDGLGYYWDQGFDSFVASTLHHDAEFIPAPTGFIGSRQGFVYKCGDQGVGYYLDSG